MNVRVKTTVNLQGFEKILAAAPLKVQQGTKEAAQDILADIRDNWSPVSPSSAGRPPALVTGTLEDSGRVRFVKGGLLSEYRVAFERVYARFLEKGTQRMAARPFLEPAMERAKKRLKQYYLRVFQK